MKLDFLNLEKIKLKINELGKLVVKINDKEFENFKVLKLFPLSKPEQFITFYDEEENEIGVLKDFRKLDNHSLELLEMELEKSYFMPEITRIDVVERVEGDWIWVVDTDKGPRDFKVKSRTRDIRKLNNGNIIIRDADGNKFKIPNLKKLDQGSITILLKQL